MTAPCDDLHAFADGQLAPEAHHSFERHLAGCDDCARELDEIMVLGALADQLLHDETAHTQSLTSPEAPPAAVPRRPPWWRRVLLWWHARTAPRWVAAGLAVGATALTIGPPVRAWLQVSPDQLLLAELRARPYRSTEARLSAEEFRSYRPASGERGQEQRVIEAMTTRHQQALSALESRRQYHLLGVVYLLGRQFARAEQALALAAPDPEVWTDRAALAYQQGHAGEALRWCGRALAARPQEGAALWNRALALEALGRLAEATSAFEDCAARNEVGWSAEAALRASVLRARLAPREGSSGPL